METKRCSKCKETKPLEEFHRNPTGANGRAFQCKQCKKEYMCQYRAEHREEMKKRNAQHYADNPNYYRQYYIDHCEEIKKYNREYRKQYRATHQETIKDYDQEYYIAHREEIIKRNCQYRIDHPEEVAAMRRRRRARKVGAEGNFTARQFTELCERYGNRCLCCGEAKKLTADHVIPLSKGGSDDISNIQPLCQPCNSKKHVQTIDYRDIKQNKNAGNSSP